MKDNKVYVLQKDLPFFKTGTEYVISDGFNGVNDMCSYVPNKLGMMHERYAIHAGYVENNPEWFLPKEKIKVLELKQVCFNSNHYEFKLSSGYSVPSLTPLIKAIESVVNDDKIEIGIRDEFDGERIYLQSEVDAIRKMAIVCSPETPSLHKNIQEEKDWEILSYYYYYAKEKYPSTENSEAAIKIIDKNNGAFEFAKDHHPIYQVLRKSDNEVFSVGEDTPHGIIKSFEISDKYSFGIGVWTNIMFVSWNVLEKIKKAKPIIFTTEDGKSVYEGDEVFSVNLSRDNHIMKWKSDDYKEFKDADPEAKHYLIFSTEEKAEEYIIQNKPCLSLNDLIKVWDVNTISRSEIIKSPMYKRFEQLVKDKINK